jgi:hypothetical protein
MSERLIALFQRKADIARRDYTKVREKTAREADQPSDLSTTWQLGVAMGTKLLAEYSTWQAAADLLRKEELHK